MSWQPVGIKWQHPGNIWQLTGNCGFYHIVVFMQFCHLNCAFRKYWVGDRPRLFGSGHTLQLILQIVNFYLSTRRETKAHHEDTKDTNATRFSLPKADITLGVRSTALPSRVFIFLRVLRVFVVSYIPRPPLRSLLLDCCQAYRALRAGA